MTQAITVVGLPRTVEKLRYAQHAMGGPSRSIPSICQELGSIRPSTLYHYLHADGAPKTPGQALLGDDAARVATPEAPSRQSGLSQ